MAVALQVGVNYANDYSDFRRGVDTPSRLGPMRAAASGAARPESVRLAALVAFAAAAIVGLGLALATDPRLLLAGAAALAAGWLYTGGPRPYGHLGLGELFVFVFFGLFATAGTAYTELLRVPAAAWPVAVAMGCLASAILVLNNLRDIETDAAAGKRTLAVRFGRRRTRWLLAVLLLGAFASPLIAVAAGWAPPAAALPVALAPLGVRLYRISATTAASRLVGALRRTAELEALFALAWTLGLLL